MESNDNHAINASLEMSNSLSVFIYPFEHTVIDEHGSDSKTKKTNDKKNNCPHAKNKPTKIDILKEAWNEGWRPWTCRLPPIPNDEKNLYQENNLYKLTSMLGTWFHPPTIEAIYPEIHRLHHCKKYYRNLCVAERDKKCFDCRAERLERQLSICRELVTKNENFDKCIADGSWHKIDKEDTIHLTYEFANEDEKEIVFSRVNKGNMEEFKARIEWVDVYLFNLQAGFLCVKFTLLKKDASGPESDLGRLMTFNQAFRDISASEQIKHKDRNQDEKLGNKDAFRRYWTFVFNKHPDQSEKEDDDSGFKLGEYIFRYKIFTTVFLENDVSHHNANNRQIDLDNPMLAPSKYYDGIGAFDGLLYEIGTTSDLFTLRGNDTTWQPSLEYFKNCLMVDNLINVWREWRGLALKDTATFLCIDKPGQPRIERYEMHFLPLYIYALNLKMQLFQISNQLNLRDVKDEDETYIMYRVVDDFLMFQKEYWFAEVSPNFQMEIIFKKYKKGLEVDEDYEGVHQEVNDVFKKLESDSNKDLSKSNQELSALVLVLTVTSVIAGFWGFSPLPGLDDLYKAWLGKNGWQLGTAPIKVTLMAFLNNLVLFTSLALLVILFALMFKRSRSILSFLRKQWRDFTNRIENK